MKDSYRPAVEIPAELLELIQSVLHEGETLPAFIKDCVTKHATWRKEDTKFYTRGIAAGKQVRETGVFYTLQESMASLREITDSVKAAKNASKLDMRTINRI